MFVPDAVCLWATFRRRPFDFLESLSRSGRLVYFFVFREVWEYHYVLLLPLFVLLYARTRARVLWVIYALAAAPTLFILYDVPGADAHRTVAAWTAFEHVLNHALQDRAGRLALRLGGAGYLRKHAKLAESRMDTGVDLVF